MVTEITDLYFQLENSSPDKRFAQVLGYRKRAKSQ